MTNDETRAEALLSAFARSRERCGEYKPVPEDFLDIIERIVDAAEDVIAWYAITGGGMTKHDGRDAMARLLDAIIVAVTYLESERTS